MKQAPDMKLKKEIAERLKAIRTEADLSQAKFADSISVTRVHYNRMESPEVEMMPSRPVLQRICDVYHVNYEWLTTGEGNAYNESSVKEPDFKDKTLFISMPLIEETIHYVTAKTTTYLKKGNMGEKRYLRYFHLFSGMLEIFFRMMGELKVIYCEHTEASDEFYDAYADEFKNLLDKQKKK